MIEFYLMGYTGQRADQPNVNTTPTTVIQTTDLTRRFGAFLAVDRIQLSVQPGEVFGLLGANGAGKTTAIRMLCGMLPPTAGSIQVAGVDMRRQPRRARAHIGYMAQRFALYHDLTVLENLKLQAGLYGLRGAHKQTRLDWALAMLDLANLATTLAANLPLGYQRRLALGAALLHEPQVLFLDEPTSGVDPLARQRFWELIYDLAEAGIGILVTTHYMDEALFCDRLALMQAGRIVSEGTPESLLQQPLTTPLLELVTPDYVACERLLQDDTDLLEIIPRAGRLRLRLRASSDVVAITATIRQRLAGQQLQITTLQPAVPELEDVFVAVLEAAEQERP
jgi:ABC-2 type transport system ATP-binding protein